MSLSLRINIVESNVTKTIVFDPTTTVYDACRIIREKCTEELSAPPKDYGLFLTDEDNKTGVWLEHGRHLEYYILRNSDTLEYRKKIRPLRVKMLDGSVKTMMVDDSQIVANLMVVVCAKLGITNHDEYSLLLEEIEEHHPIDPNANYGTLTLRRRRDERERDAKMEMLRKKLHTDDEVNWLDPSKTLREQGINESETVLLRRKFFFSDQNIDSHDPIQLNLLYVQARDSIVNGTHPIVEAKACEFAGIQCQVQFGDHVEAKHKHGFLDLREFLPQSFVKNKGIEKKIFTEHRRRVGLNELEAKALYTKMARSLNTHGVTFFLVKEKMKGKNKLAPRLLGVTKESVLRLDENTKEILQSWPLTTVRRWGASPNTFTLDFGDYSDQYYSVQTTEAEQIQQIIAGYIDIILKKKQAKDYIGIEGDEGSTMFEENVASQRASILQHEVNKVGKISTESVAKPAVMRAGTEGEKTIITGISCRAQYTSITGQVNKGNAPPMVQQPKITAVMSEPQSGLLSAISTMQRRIKKSEMSLDVRTHFPQIGTDLAARKWKQATLDTRKQNVGSQIAAMNAATAQVVTLTSNTQDEMDYKAVGAAITTIGSNLPEMTEDVKMIAALMDDSSVGEKLLDATRNLCDAFSDLLTAAEPNTHQPRQHLLSAATRVGEASTSLLGAIGEEAEEHLELQDTLLTLAKTTAVLVLKAKNIAAVCDRSPVQDRVISAATQCALATSQLVACAKVTAPTIHSTACQEQLMVAVREVAHSVEYLTSICNEATADPDLQCELNVAAAEVTRTLNELVDHIKMACIQQPHETVQEVTVEKIYTATEKLSVASGDPHEMVRQAKRLAQATAELIQSIKGESTDHAPDSDIQRRLLAAAKTLADATAALISFPNDANNQLQLRITAENLRDITTIAATTPAARARLVDRVQICAKKAIGSASQCITAAQASYEYNSSQMTRASLQRETEELERYIPSLVGSIKAVSPDNTGSQVGLMYAAEVFLHPATQYVHTSTSVLPTINEHTVTEQLSITSQQLNTDLSELRSAIIRAKPVCHGLGVGAAQQMIGELHQDLDECQKALERHALCPLPRDNRESAIHELVLTTKSINQGVSQLLSASAQHNDIYVDKAAADIVHSLKAFCEAVRSVAATSDDPDGMARDLLKAAQDVVYHCGRLVDAVHRNPNDLQPAARDITTALERTTGCLPGQRDVINAISNIDQWALAIDTTPPPPPNVGQKSYGELQQQLNKAAAHLNEASSVIVRSVRSPADLASASKDFSHSFQDLFDASLAMAAQIQSADVREHLIQACKMVSISSSALLSTAKALSVDPSMPNGKNELAKAARDVTDAINALLMECSSAAPGQSECDNAVRQIQAMRPLLDTPSEPISDHTYFETLDMVIEESKLLGEAMTGITTGAKKSQSDYFVDNIKVFSGSICHLVEAAAQSAYLMGVSDPTSTAGRLGLVDQAQYARAAQAIRQGCAALTSSTSPQKQVLEAATLIAKHTSSLCNSCRIASSKTANPVAKRQFVQSAKSVANTTAALVKEIKVLDLDYSIENRRRCADATIPLLDAVDSLCVYANSNEFVSIPAKISEQGRHAQQPIIESGRKLIDSSSAVVRAAKDLIIMPKDPPTWQQFASASKDVSDSIKQLVENIRSRSPGKSECEMAVSILNSHLRSLDTASMDAVSQSLLPHRGATLPVYCQQMERAAANLHDAIEPLRQAARFETENIGHTINQMIQYFDPLVQNTIGAASNMKNSKQQEDLLEQAKSITESALQLIYATKDCGGNPKATNLHPVVDDCAGSTREAIQELMTVVEDISTQNGVVSGVLENLTRAMTRLSDHRASFLMSDDSFVDYQTRMVDCTKAIAKIAGEMASKMAGADAQITPRTAELAHKYTELANDCMGAAAATTSTEVGMRLREVVQQLGRACVDLVQVGGQCWMRKDDILLRELGDASREVIEKVSRVLATLQKGSRGTQACINASSTVSGIIADLETTIMFATAGNLNPENENDSFADHRENILKTAKALVEDTKTLVAGAASNQEQLAVAAHNSVTTIVQLAEVVKFGAASLGSNNPDSQVMLINAVKDVASALNDLIQATKSASGKPINDPAMSNLKDSAKVVPDSETDWWISDQEEELIKLLSDSKETIASETVMVTNVTSLLKTVKAVEDEHTRGTRALESTIEVIGQEMKTLYSRDGCRTGITAEDLMRCTKAITNATSKSMAAGISNKQDDIIAAANLTRKSISDMLVVCKSAAYNLAETPELRERTLKAGQECASQFRDLLSVILQGNVKEAKQILPNISRKLAQTVTELTTCAKLLKGSDWVDPDDPTVIAENELLSAAASIDAAARKLACLQPRRSVKTPEVDETLNFDTLILEAAKSITYAISALIKAASAAQRELIDSGKVSGAAHCAADDGQWSEGLVSAARLVAAATHSLVESANALVQGLGSEDKLISSAKQVAFCTAQLLVACKVKAKGDTETTQRLQQAGNAVVRSTDNLVRAAQQSKDVEDERCLVLNKKMVGGMAQEIDARSEVLRMERQLEEARNKLNAIRQAKYKVRDMDGDEPSTPDDYNNSNSLNRRRMTADSSRYNFSNDFNDSQQISNNNQYSPTAMKSNFQPSTNFSTDTNYSQLESPYRVNSLDHGSTTNQYPLNINNCATNGIYQQSNLLQTMPSHINNNHHIYGTTNQLLDDGSGTGIVSGFRPLKWSPIQPSSTTTTITTDTLYTPPPTPTFKGTTQQQFRTSTPSDSPSKFGPKDNNNGRVFSPTMRNQYNATSSMEHSMVNNGYGTTMVPSSSLYGTTNAMVVPSRIESDLDGGFSSELASNTYRNGDVYQMSTSSSVVPVTSTTTSTTQVFDEPDQRRIVTKTVSQQQFMEKRDVSMTKSSRQQQSSMTYKYTD